MVECTMENSLARPQKLKSELPYNSAILLLVYTQRNENSYTNKNLYINIQMHYS